MNKNTNGFITVDTKPSFCAACTILVAEIFARLQTACLPPWARSHNNKRLHNLHNSHSRSTTLHNFAQVCTDFGIGWGRPGVKTFLSCVFLALLNMHWYHDALGFVHNINSLPFNQFDLFWVGCSIVLLFDPLNIWSSAPSFLPAVSAQEDKWRKKERYFQNWESLRWERYLW